MPGLESALATGAGELHEKPSRSSTADVSSSSTGIVLLAATGLFYHQWCGHSPCSTLGASSDGLHAY